MSPRLRIVIWIGLGALFVLAIGLFTYFALVVDNSIRPLKVPKGDQEIAWFHTATSTSTWERFVTGAHIAARHQPRLRVDDCNAFPEQTTAVPELVISLDGFAQKLRVRWYKQGGQVNVEDWVRELAKRDPPPLAIVGGGSSDRAVELAQVLAAQTSWRGPAPLLLITTATADEFAPQEFGREKVDLTSVYAGRSFRFCFTNRQMAEAVLDFVWRQPELRPQGNPQAGFGAIGLAASGDVWGSLGLLAHQADFPGQVLAVQWGDDPYSVDLAGQFRAVLSGEANRPVALTERPWVGQVSIRHPFEVPSSVGSYLRPNAKEAQAIDRLLNGEFGFPPISREPLQRSLLILPTVPQPARRVLAGLTGSAPDLGRHLVAVSGDSISFNHVYRDGPLIWNARLVPIPLVFFTHQDPVAWDPPDRKQSPPAQGDPCRDGSPHPQYFLDPPNGTDDVLNFTGLVRMLAEAAFDISPSREPGDLLLSNADELEKRLREVRQTDGPQTFFRDDGNRRGGSGEYVIYLRPRLPGDSVGPPTTIEVWTHRATGWQRVRDPLEVKYK